MTHISLGNVVWPPAQFLLLIRNKPIWDPRTATPVRVPLDSATEDLLIKTFADGRAAIRYDADEVGQDTWDAPERLWQAGILSPGRWIKTGDCDEYVFEWASRLLAAGLSPGAMRYVVCRTESQVMHLVLTVDCVERTLVFCNRQQGLWTYGEGPMLQYHWLKSSEPGQFLWREVLPPESS